LSARSGPSWPPSLAEFGRSRQDSRSLFLDVAGYERQEKVTVGWPLLGSIKPGISEFERKQIGQQQLVSKCGGRTYLG